MAGFNQFFDDPNGTRAKRMGIGLDSRILNKLFSGIEVSERDLKIPSRFSSTQEDFSLQNEKSYRNYIYWLPHSHWAFRAELEFENFIQKNPTNSSDPNKIQTLSAPLNIEYFHPSGLFSKFSATFVKQNLQRLSDHGKKIGEGIVCSGTECSGINSFFLLDYVFGYRLANRRGILSAEARNLLDESFYYRNYGFYTSEPINSRFIPSRTFFLKLTLNF